MEIIDIYITKMGFKDDDSSCRLLEQLGKSWWQVMEELENQGCLNDAGEITIEGINELKKILITGFENHRHEVNDAFKEKYKYLMQLLDKAIEMKSTIRISD